MTTALYCFIATKTARDTVVPARARTQNDFNRQVRGAIGGMAGGKTLAGNLLLRPTQAAVANHLLCDGTVLDIIDFPELAAYLGTTFGGDGTTTFGLPDYSAQALAVPALTVTQTVSTAGTVSTGGTVTQPSGAGQTGGSTGGNVPSGGRPRQPYEQEQ